MFVTLLHSYGSCVLACCCRLKVGQQQPVTCCYLNMCMRHSCSRESCSRLLTWITRSRKTQAAHHKQRHSVEAGGIQIDRRSTLGSAAVADKSQRQYQIGETCSSFPAVTGAAGELVAVAGYNQQTSAAAAPLPQISEFSWLQGISMQTCLQELPNNTQRLNESSACTLQDALSVARCAGCAVTAPCQPAPAATTHTRCSTQHTQTQPQQQPSA